MKQIDSLDLTNAKMVLGGLKQYADLRKKLGNRGKSLFHRQTEGKKAYLVEYSEGISEDIAWMYAKGVYEKSFSETPSQDEVVFHSHSTLKGGIKVYCDDHMVDVSFKKVEKQMQK